MKAKGAKAASRRGGPHSKVPSAHPFSWQSPMPVGRRAPGIHENVRERGHPARTVPGIAARNAGRMPALPHISKAAKDLGSCFWFKHSRGTAQMLRVGRRPMETPSKVTSFTRSLSSAKAGGGNPVLPRHGPPLSRG